MKIGTPKELHDSEARVAMTPESAAQLQKLGYECLIQSGAGMDAGFSDAAYEEAGVKVVKTAATLWKNADIVAKVRPPSDAEVKKLTKGQTLISLFYPAANEKLMEAGQCQGRPCHRHGHGPAHLAGTKDGRAELDGQHSRLPGGDRSRAPTSTGSSPVR